MSLFLAIDLGATASVMAQHASYLFCTSGGAMKATAIAHANIAVVKYWGKRADTAAALNLPAVGSLSLTLGGLSTETTVELDGDQAADSFCWLAEDGQPAAADERTAARVGAFLDLLRQRGGPATAARVTSRNDFPTGAGLASSASGFAALALAGAKAMGLDLSRQELATLARQGSGSAARSIFGGFVELQAGSAADGNDCYVDQIATHDHWPLVILVAITTLKKKAVGSTLGMQRTAETSPYYPAWITSHPADLRAAKEAIVARDFARLAEVTEHSCLKMHGSMLSAQPGLVYWNSATMAVIETVLATRQAGVPCCYTIDAGPQVKVICEATSAAAVRARLEEIPGVLRVTESGLGRGARLL